MFEHVNLYTHAGDYRFVGLEKPPGYYSVKGKVKL